MSFKLLASLGLASLAMAMPQSAKSESLHKRYLETRNGVEYNVFKREGAKSSLAYVEDSGICVRPTTTTVSTMGKRRSER